MKDYAIIAKEYLGFNEFYKLFDVLKYGGFMAINGWGLSVKPMKGYVEVAIVHTGEKFDKNVFINMTTQKNVKKEHIAEVMQTKEEDIFG